MKEENGGTSPAKKWTKKGYNPEEWRPDLAGVSEVVAAGDRPTELLDVRRVARPHDGGAALSRLQRA